MPSHSRLRAPIPVVGASNRPSQARSYRSGRLEATIWRSRVVENQTSTCGKTWRRLRTIPATTDNGSWYNWSHWQKTPSSARRARTIRKYSGVYGVAHPGEVLTHVQDRGLKLHHSHPLYARNVREHAGRHAALARPGVQAVV